MLVNTSRPENHYKRWTPEQEQFVVNAYVAKEETAKIAESVKRTEHAVVSKIVQIRCEPDENQLELHNMLVNTEEPQEQNETHPLLGQHVIYGMKLMKITRVYTTLNGTTYVLFEGGSTLSNIEEVRGSIVDKVYSL